MLVGAQQMFKLLRRCFDSSQPECGGGHFSASPLLLLPTRSHWTDVAIAADLTVILPQEEMGSLPQVLGFLGGGVLCRIVDLHEGGCCCGIL